MKSVVKRIVVEIDPEPERIRQIMRKAGSNFGTVHFIKKDGKLRKMSYRVGVRRPKWLKAPGSASKTRVSRPKRNTDVLMTVYDVNTVHRDRNGNVLRDEDGRLKRGGYRSVPLLRVKRIVVNGVRYKIERTALV